MEPLKDVGTLFFCDETKFSKNDQDTEDAIYYFAVAVPKRDVPKISNEFNELLIKRRIQAKTFHSTSVFKKNRVREELMTDLTSLLINNHLSCFCIKYEKSWMLEPTKRLNYLNNDILKFNNAEFQALFYFLVILNLFLTEANAVEDFNLGILVGQPSGSIPNEHGEIMQLKLPRSGLGVYLPSAFYVRANGDLNNPNPVLPDLYISRKVLEEMSTSADVQIR